MQASPLPILFHLAQFLLEEIQRRATNEISPSGKQFPFMTTRLHVIYTYRQWEQWQGEI